MSQLRKLRWKIDLVILPMFLITQALQFMDKTSLNYANILGYQAALGLKGQEFNYLSASAYFSDGKWKLPAWSLTECFSGLRWLFLRSISLRLAHWQIPCSESYIN